jgi:5-methylcytosine-specific restriction endonuclease McrA
MNQTLLLNADARPISFLPISSISWQEAVKFTFSGTAEVLHSYDDWNLHSPSTTMPVPAVIILKDQVKNVRTWVAREAGGPQKHLVFLRDLYVCQYCNEQFPRRRLTIDHVIPRYHGGRTKWDNVTTACTECNCRRGHDMNQQPRNKPFRPTYGDLLKNMRKFPVSLPHETWNYYLGWPEELTRIVNPKARLVNENVDFGIRISMECSDI